MAIVLGPNQYGKAEVRVVAVDRSTPRHTLVDLAVSSALRGDFAGAFTDGDNSHILATDTQKNTVFAFARDGISTPEEFGLRLARHFAGSLRLDHRRADRRSSPTAGTGSPSAGNRTTTRSAGPAARCAPPSSPPTATTCTSSPG